MPFFFLLYACKDHLGSMNILLWVYKIFIQGIITPCNTFLFISFSVGKAFCLACLSAIHAMQVWSCFVLSTCFTHMALSTHLLEKFFSILRISTYTHSEFLAECVL